jgi:Protein of unknown function (DUF1236)
MGVEQIGREIKENSMRKATFLTTMFGATLLFGIASATAQPTVEFQWTPEVERGVYSRVTRERIRTPPPAGFDVTVGAEVPAAVELYEVPADIEYAPVRRYRYTVHDDRVYVIDPGTRRVVRILRR